jgi:hypothetical protein
MKCLKKMDLKQQKLLKQLDSKYGIVKYILIDRATVYTKRLGGDIGDIIYKFENMFPKIDFDVSSFRIIAYEPLVIIGWNTTRTKKYLIIDGVNKQPYYEANNPKEVNEQYGAYVRYLSNRARCIRDQLPIESSMECVKRT